ncbi:MAG: TraB/GumN family protein [Candidatus Bathyarchaeota archaeon]|nr:MAG: TraB/GumN family protein [Candidatus Bathyarchaeota archaeon]
MGTKILDIDYNEYVSLLGTAHFTKRSLMDAYESVRRLKPTDLAIELDMQRFQYLNQRCAYCAESEFCVGRCEFLGAADALGNVDANIWLIDMSEREIAERVQRLIPLSKLWRFSLVSFPFRQRYNDDDMWLWEKGYKDEVLEKHARRLETLRKRAPHVWRVLIDERNALMAARLAWIVTQRLNNGGEIKILALTGAAHVNGIRELLRSPLRIGDELHRLGLRFTTPRLIRRVGIN